VANRPTTGALRRRTGVVPAARRVSDGAIRAAVRSAGSAALRQGAQRAGRAGEGLAQLSAALRQRLGRPAHHVDHPAECSTLAGDARDEAVAAGDGVGQRVVVGDHLAEQCVALHEGVWQRVEQLVEVLAAAGERRARFVDQDREPRARVGVQHVDHLVEVGRRRDARGRDREARRSRVTAIAHRELDALASEEVDGRDRRADVAADGAVRGVDVEVGDHAVAGAEVQAHLADLDAAAHHVRAIAQA
jgi:hypothetical protein